MIIKKVFYQLNKNDDWKPAITIEDCSGELNGRVISEEGDLLPILFYDIREAANHCVLVSI